MRAFLSKTIDWLWGDVELPATKRWRRAEPAVRAIVLGLAVSFGLHATRELRTTPPPDPLPATGPNRLGLPESQRRALFRELAVVEPRARTESAQKFPGDPWSIEDERAAHERDKSRDMAAANKLSVSQIDLLLDDGIREKWPAPNSKPLDATVVPLKRRPE